MNRHLIDVTDIMPDDFDRLKHLALRVSRNHYYKDVVSGIRRIPFGILFMENSTRTRWSFHQAAMRLGMHHITILKGECKEDTLWGMVEVMEGMGVEVAAVRIPGDIYEVVNATTTMRVINAGDGAHAHPTQALGDMMYLMLQRKFNPEGKRLVVVGDVKHCRVAHSFIKLAHTLGMLTTIVAPQLWMPYDEVLPIDRYEPELKLGLKDADVILTFRPQVERHNPDEAAVNYDPYQLTYSKISHWAPPEVIVLHPGPRTNTELDIVAAQCYWDARGQVAWGTHVRTALIYLMMDGA